MPRPVNMRTGLLKFARRKFALLTIGSRGDVQPFIALGQRLKAVGQDVRCAVLDLTNPCRSSSSRIPVRRRLARAR